MTQIKKELFSGFISLLFGLFVLLMSFTIGKTRLAGVGPEYLPKAIAIYIIGLSVIHILVNLMIRNSSENRKADETKTSEIKSLVLTIILLILYVLLLKSVGFILISALYLFTQMNILAPAEKKNLPLFGILSAVVPVGVYFLFVNVFDLLLPSGILG